MRLQSTTRRALALAAIGMSATVNCQSQEMNIVTFFTQANCGGGSQTLTSPAFDPASPCISSNAIGDLSYKCTKILAGQQVTFFARPAGGNTCDAINTAGQCTADSDPNQCFNFDLTDGENTQNLGFVIGPS